MSDYMKDPFDRCYDGAVMNAVYAANKVIGERLGFTPREEYVVGRVTGSCYHPANMGYDWPPEQKSMCERWVADMKEYCELEGYTVQRREFWPLFHQDWNELMEAYRRGLAQPERFLYHTPGIEIRSTWEILAKACGADLSLVENWKEEERASAGSAKRQQ